jgi:hypothetical protein
MMRLGGTVGSVTGLRAARRADPVRADATCGAGQLGALAHTVEQAVVATVPAVVITVGTFWVMGVPVALPR